MSLLNIVIAYLYCICLLHFFIAYLCCVSLNHIYIAYRCRRGAVFFGLGLGSIFGRFGSVFSFIASVYCISSLHMSVAYF